jgi:hypothetical protein
MAAEKAAEKAAPAVEAAPAAAAAAAAAEPSEPAAAAAAAAEPSEPAAAAAAAAAPAETAETAAAAAAAPEDEKLAAEAAFSAAAADERKRIEASLAAAVAWAELHGNLLLPNVKPAGDTTAAMKVLHDVAGYLADVVVPRLVRAGVGDETRTRADAGGRRASWLRSTCRCGRPPLCATPSAVHTISLSALVLCVLMRRAARGVNMRYLGRVAKLVSRDAAVHVRPPSAARCPRVPDPLWAHRRCSCRRWSPARPAASCALSSAPPPHPSLPRRWPPS